MPRRKAGPCSPEHSYFAYVNCVGIDEIYGDYQQREAIIFQPISDKPWGMREFGVATPEGHRMMFGEDIGSTDLENDL